jgi:non-homologous end joining protein Ku
MAIIEHSGYEALLHRFLWSWRIWPKASEEEPALMTKITDRMTTDPELRIIHDGWKERSEAMINTKMKGEIAHVKEERPQNPVARSMLRS